MIFEGLFCYKLHEVFVILWYNGGMNEDVRKALEIKAQNLIALRTAYFTIVVGLTGGLFGLLYNLSILNIFFLITGGILDYCLIIVINNITKQINKIVRNLFGG